MKVMTIWVDKLPDGCDCCSFKNKERCPQICCATQKKLPPCDMEHIRDHECPLEIWVE